MELWTKMGSDFLGCFQCSFNSRFKNSIEMMGIEIAVYLFTNPNTLGK